MYPNRPAPYRISDLVVHRNPFCLYTSFPFDGQLPFCISTCSTAQRLLRHISSWPNRVGTWPCREHRASTHMIDRFIYVPNKDVCSSERTGLHLLDYLLRRSDTIDYVRRTARHWPPLITGSVGFTFVGNQFPSSHASSHDSATVCCSPSSNRAQDHPAKFNDLLVPTRPGHTVLSSSSIAVQGPIRSDLHSWPFKEISLSTFVARWSTSVCHV